MTAGQHHEDSTVALSIAPPPWRRLVAIGAEFLRSRLATGGLILVAIMVGSAALAPLLSAYAPEAMDYTAILQPPSWAHLFGTDELGRDIFSRSLYGARLSLAVGVGAVLLAASIGIPLGLIAGYKGGWLDAVFMRILDSLMALPPLVLALTISAVLGSGLVNATVAIAIVSVPTFARLIRGQVLSLKHHEFVQAAESVGVRTVLIIFRHILPNAVNPAIVQASLAIGFAIILESSLSFIGLGAQPPASTWGSMVQVGFQYLEIAPWYPLIPATLIFIAVLSFNLFGEGLRQLLDPAARTRG
ncbi:peptide/nickel transport system permease protein [Rhodoligotrophos appendicifer]|uniref:ABC transporter permease n=1 Tax=Rhodoligotrophos appendicifer TaxID=987056 RepID=UPI00117D00C9|nr:ABC transporter permease [Rhodoligotrophos appendicifer]